MKTFIVPYEDKYREDAREICYRTGYTGEDLTGKGVFNDRELFCLLFVDYYISYEKDNSFLAIDPKIDRAVGYILGTLDSRRQAFAFVRKMLPKIFGQIFRTTLFSHPESMKAVFVFIRSLFTHTNPKGLFKDYPAHLHINVLEEYQDDGTGSRLLEIYEGHLLSRNCRGVHLQTTDQNTKAVRFYLKKGYRQMDKKPAILWAQQGVINELIFGKILRGEENGGE